MEVIRNAFAIPIFRLLWLGSLQRSTAILVESSRPLKHESIVIVFKEWNVGSDILRAPLDALSLD